MQQPHNHRGQVGSSSRTMFAQVDGGSDVSCILKWHVVALSLGDQMVPRKATRQFRVGGIGQQAGSERW